MVYESIPPSLRTRVKKASRLSEKVDLGTIELTDSEDSEPRPTKRSRIRGGRRSGMLVPREAWRPHDHDADAPAQADQGKLMAQVISSRRSSKLRMS